MPRFGVDAHRPSGVRHTHSALHPILAVALFLGANGLGVQVATKGFRPKA